MVYEHVEKSRALYVDTDLIRALVIMPPLYPVFKFSLPMLSLPLIMHSDLTPSISLQLQTKMEEKHKKSIAPKFPKLTKK